METPLSIVITTYNREVLLKRCLNSIKKQNYENYEVIVVDDHSDSCYKEGILNEFPEIKFLRQDKNSGPGPARNMGIREATNNYIIIMDDDDIFKREAFAKINKFLLEYSDDSYPVYNFLISNAKIEHNSYYTICSLSDLINGSVSGDMLHILNKKIFLEGNNYKFPESKIGAESLLWFKISSDYGIPIINEVIVELCEDAENRLTNFDRQVTYSIEFAEYQLTIIKLFEKEILAISNKLFLVQRYIAAITYLLLSGKRKASFITWIKLFNYTYKHIVLIPLFFLPKALLVKLFLLYRKQ